MYGNKGFNISLIFVENKSFEVPTRFHDFTLGRADIEGCVRELDKRLYENDVIGHLNDFTAYYNHDETECRVTFGDSECGLTINFEVKEV